MLNQLLANQDKYCKKNGKEKRVLKADLDLALKELEVLRSAPMVLAQNEFRDFEQGFKLN